MAGVAERLFATFKLDAAKQQALLRLRLRLLRRQFEREPGQMVGFLVFLVIFGPLVLLVATASGFAYVAAPDPWPVQVMGIVLSVLWLIWIVLPLLAFRTNEGLDLSRLLVTIRHAARLGGEHAARHALRRPQLCDAPLFSGHAGRLV
ncbi:MAG: hypothetical protein IPM07_15475 [Anaerolineales bacterium]|nr:hypothetical protein [Anaerolineales bacterium]